MSEAIQKLINGVHQIEALNEQNDGLKEDIKEIYADLKSEGFDTKVIRMLIKVRAEDPDKLAETESLLDTYIRALSNGDDNRSPVTYTSQTDRDDNAEYGLVDSED